MNVTNRFAENRWPIALISSTFFLAGQRRQVVLARVINGLGNGVAYEPWVG
jgi:hypothetical protein